jgi:hypothetical protein
MKADLVSKVLTSPAICQPPFSSVSIERDHRLRHVFLVIADARDKPAAEQNRFHR